MKRRTLLAFISVLLLALVALAGAASGGGAQRVKADLSAEQLGFLPVVLKNYRAGVTPPPAPQITSFTAGPATIEPGGSSTLRWSYSGDVDSLTISPGVGSVLGKNKAIVSPEVTTEYTLTAVNRSGTTTAKVTVTVEADVPAPQISSFTATPAAIELGQSTTLAWAVSGDVDSLTVSPGNVDVSGESDLVVSPDETTTYTLTAVNAGGQDTAQVTVTVTVPEPQINSFSAAPASIDEGQSTTLSWSVTGPVDSLSISPGVGDVTGDTSVSVSPAQTTVYTLTAENVSGQVTAQTTVTVVPAKPEITSFSANPATIQQLGSATLSWQTSGQVDSLNITANVGPNVGDVTGKSSIAVSPMTTTEYTLTAVNSGGQTTKKTTVTVTAAPGAPQITSFVAWPEKPIAGQPTLLRWETVGALNSLILRADDGSDPTSVLGQTQIELTPTAATTMYRLTAKNDEGEAETTVIVERVAAGDVAPLLVFDRTGPVGQNLNGFPRFQPPTANGNWRTPYNYAEGRLYYRVEVSSQPVAQDMKLQYCVWQELNGDNFGLENCGPSRSVSGTPGTVVEWSGTVASMWKLNGEPLEWERPRFRDAFAIKTAANCPVSGFNIDVSLAPGCPVREDDPTLLALWANENPAEWYPLDVRLRVYVIAKGDSWPGWESLP